MKILVDSARRRMMRALSRCLAVMAASVVVTLSACASQATPPSTATAGAQSTPVAGTSAAGLGVSAQVAGVPAAGNRAIVPGAGTAAGGSSVTGPMAGNAGATAGAAAPTGAATFTAVLAIFADQRNNCGLCHAMQTIGGGLIFNPTDRMATFQALVGPTSKGTLGSQCAGKTYVVPGQPDASLLYDKLSKATPICGVRMPASGVVLTDMEIATVRAWIAAGAANN